MGCLLSKAVGAFSVARAAERAEAVSPEYTFEERKRLLAALEMELREAMEQIEIVIRGG